MVSIAYTVSRQHLFGCLGSSGEDLEIHSVIDMALPPMNKISNEFLHPEQHIKKSLSCPREAAFAVGCNTQLAMELHPG